MKIENDAYYTPVELANELWDKTVNIIGAENITYVVEPSCGDGSFLQHPQYRVNFACDIATECYGMVDTFLKGDYLTMDIPRYKGMLVIGNPPFRNRMQLAQKFFKHSMKFADFIAFILPISQLNNTQSLFEFDLIHSEDLGLRDYSGRKLHCCFNVYKRPLNGLNPPPKTDSGLVKIYRDKDNVTDFDLRMGRRGSCCRVLHDNEHYHGEYKIKVVDETRKQEIIYFIKTYPWREIAKSIAAPCIYIHHIHQALIERFGEREDPNLFD